MCGPNNVIKCEYLRKNLQKTTPLASKEIIVSLFFSSIECFYELGPSQFKETQRFVFLGSWADIVCRGEPRVFKAFLFLCDSKVNALLYVPIGMGTSVSLVKFDCFLYFDE